MALADFDINALRQKIRDAYDTDDPILKQFREYARRLQGNIKPLRTYQVNAVSFVPQRSASPPHRPLCPWLV